jgi:carboxyl-terminal processing protease
MRKVPLIAAPLVAIVVGGVAGSERSPATDTYRPLALYSEAISIIHDQYVEVLPWTKLVEDGTSGMVQTLDADSALLGPEELRELRAPADGDVGIVLGRRNGTLVVIAALDGTPARGAGLRSGDDVLKIDGASTERMLALDGADRLRGRPGTVVTLSVARAGWAEPRAFTLARAEPPSDRVSDRALGDGILYVRIPGLRQATAGELDHVLGTLPPERSAGLILDLRDTARGQVAAAVAVAGMFLGPGCVVARVESRTSGKPGELLAPAPVGRHDQPMAVLVNHGTASAAEVLAGALQDWRRAILVGGTTFGDASAQSLIPLSGGWALSLTTARYLTPKGHAISGKGIGPDLSAGTPPAGDPGPAATTAKPEATDPEVRLAFDLVKAALVFEHAPRPAPGSEQVRPPVRWCGSPAA